MNLQKAPRTSIFLMGIEHNCPKFLNSGHPTEKAGKIQIESRFSKS